MSPASGSRIRSRARRRRRHGGTGRSVRVTRVDLDGPRVTEQLVLGGAVDALAHALDGVIGEPVKAEPSLPVTEAEVPQLEARGRAHARLVEPVVRRFG